jgi:hypothetical protein
LKNPYKLVLQPAAPVPFQSVMTCAPKPAEVVRKIDWEYVDVPNGYHVRGGIIVPQGTKRELPRMQRMPYKNGKRVELRIIVDIQVKARLNMKLWGDLKLPKGWRKSPRQSWKNDNNFPVRLYAYEPRSLSGEELENIRAQLSLMEMI